MANDLSDSTARLYIDGKNQPTATVTIGPATPSVKLPVIKFEPFAGNIEAWSRFCEQIQSSNDENASLSTIKKKFPSMILEGGAKNIVGRNSCDSKYIRRVQENSARKI